MTLRVALGLREVDNNGFIVPNKWGYCGKKCPVDVNPWSTDGNVKVTHHNFDQQEILTALKLYGIMSSSLLLIGIMVAGLGISRNKT